MNAFLGVSAPWRLGVPFQILCQTVHNPSRPEFNRRKRREQSSERTEVSFSVCSVFSCKIPGHRCSPAHSSVSFCDLSCPFVAIQFPFSRIHVVKIIRLQFPPSALFPPVNSVSIRHDRWLKSFGRGFPTVPFSCLQYSCHGSLLCGSRHFQSPILTCYQLLTTDLSHFLLS